MIRRLNAARLSGFESFAQTLTHTEHEQLAQALATLLEQRPDLAECRPEDAIR